MRLGEIPKDRCHNALKYEDNLYTRCMFRRGHGAKHEGKGIKKFPFQRLVWFSGDGREFITDKDHEWAWSKRGIRT